MSKRRRIELALAVLAVVFAGAVALLVDPLPPLERATRPSDGWARGIEFVAIVLLIWMALGILGFMQTKIGIGLNGVSGERAVFDQVSDAAAQEIRDATRSLAEHVQLLAGKVEVLLDMQRQTTRRVDDLVQRRALDSSGATDLDDDIDSTPASLPGSPE